MQHKSENYLEFSERTESLAKKLGLNLSDLPEKIGVSPSMFYAYRSGKYAISGKAWRKLGFAEAGVGIVARQSQSQTQFQQSGPVEEDSPFSELPASAQHFAAGVQAMMLEMAEMRKRVAYLEDLFKKGPPRL
jgi:hypothetical protein